MIVSESPVGRQFSDSFGQLRTYLCHKNITDQNSQVEQRIEGKIQESEKNSIKIIYGALSKNNFTYKKNWKKRNLGNQKTFYFFSNNFPYFLNFSNLDRIAFIIEKQTLVKMEETGIFINLFWLYHAIGAHTHTKIMRFLVMLP